MMKELFTGSEPNETKIGRLRKYVESGKFLETLFFPQEFLESLAMLATKILNSTEPEKKSSFISGRNESRYTVLRVLNKFILKDVRSVGLVHALHDVLRNDNLPNVILSLKALGSVSRSGVISGDLVDVHVGALLGTIHDLFVNMENGDEGLIEMSLFTLTEMLNHARAFFHGLEYHVTKVDQFLACVYGNIRRILESRRFMDLVGHKRVFSISMCSGICSLLKLTYEQLPVVSKSGPYWMFASEAAFVGMYYCPSELLDLRGEIYTLFTKMCLASREMALPMIDKIYMVPFLFSPDALPTSAKGIGMLSEILGYMKESLSKTSYIEFGSRVSNVLFSSCSLVGRLCKESSGDSNKGLLFEERICDEVVQHIETIRTSLEAVESMCKCFGGRTGAVEELCSFYLRSFYDMRNGFEGIKRLAELGCSGQKEEFRRLMGRFISGFKEVVGRIGVLEKSGSTAVFSMSETHILYEMFEDSFDVLSHEHLCEEQRIEEFFSVLVLIREHVASDIVRCCSERILRYSKRNAGFFGAWRLMSNSAVLGNSLGTYILPRLIEELRGGNFGFVKKAMRYVVPFFGNDIKKIKRVNTFFMHRIISTLMTEDPRNIQYFEVLLEIFNSFGSMAEKSSFFQKYIFDNFGRIVEHLMKLYESQGKDIFIGMIFALPISINLLESDIQLLISPIEKALKLGGAIRVRALSILLYVLDFSTPEKVVGLEKAWKSILQNVVCGLKDSSVSSLCSKILGKLKSYHRVFIKDGEESGEMNEDLALIRLVVDEKHAVPAHLLFFDAVQKIRGAFDMSAGGFGCEGFLVRFRRLGPRCDDEEAVNASFKFMTKVIYHLVGWRFFKRDLVLECCAGLLDEMERLGSVVYALDHVYSVHGAISSICGRRCSESRHLAQYIYDAILALFSCHGTPLEKKAQELLHSIFGSVMVHRIFSFYKLKSKRYKILFDTDTFLDALVESFSDVGNPMPFRILSVMFVQMYELLGSRSEDFCVEMYGAIFSKLESMCRSSDRRCRDSGINGIMCLTASMPIRELVLLRIPEDAFSCTYLYLLPRELEDFSLPLRLVIFILRFRYRGIRGYLLSEGTEKYFMMSHFRPFVVGLFDSRRDVVEFSKTVLREIFESYAPQLLERYKDVVFGHFKKEYVIGNRTVMMMHLQVFIFCVREGRCPFDDCEMKYLIEKFLDNIAGNDEWKGAGIYMGFDYRERSGKVDREKLCGCQKKLMDDEEDLVVVLGGIYKRLSELSMRDLMELVLKDAMDVLCGNCKRRVHGHTEARSPHFNNEAEELMYWIREFYLLVIEYRRSFEEVRTGILYLLKYVSDDSRDYLRAAYEAKPQETIRVVSEEVERCLSEKVDYKVLNMLLCAHLLPEVPENPRVGMLVLKILKEFRVPKEFAIIAQNDRYSMLAKAYEIGILLQSQESLCNEILETYFVLDGCVRSYTSKMHPQMVRYVERLGSQFISCVFRRIQDPSAYNLCSRMCRDSLRLREVVSGMKDRLAERISQIYCRLEGNDSIDRNVFVHSYKFLDLVGYEMKPVDIQVVLGIYGDVKAKARHAAEMKGLIDKCINRFSIESLEMLFKLDPWFVCVEGIDPKYLAKGLSLQALRGVVRGIDKRSERVSSQMGSSLGENRYLVIELFVEMGINSPELIGYCKENLHNTNIRGILLYYLCTFEPLYVYFEILFKIPYEDRKYTLYCLEKIVDAFDPLLFEEIILIVLRSEVRFKTSLWILFPLLLSRPALISKKIGLELIGSIYKLLNSESLMQQRTGFRLFEALYKRYPPKECVEYDLVMRNTYTLMYVRFVHTDADLPEEVLGRYDLELVFELVEYSPQRVNPNNVFAFVEMEVSSKKSEEYKNRLLRNVFSIVGPHFKSRALSVQVAEYLIDNLLWGYRTVPEELGVVAYDWSTLCNLLCILCDRVARRIEAGGGEWHSNDAEDMEICLAVLRHLLGDPSKSRSEMYRGHVDRGLEKIFYVLSRSSGMKSVVSSVTRLFLEVFGDSSMDMESLVSRVNFLMSDSRVTLADKIEIIYLLDNRRYDAEFLSEMLLPVFNSYRHSGIVFPDRLQRFFMRGLCSRSRVLRSGYLDLMNRSLPANKYLRLLRLLDMEWRHSTKVGYTIVAMMMLSYHTTEVVADKYYKSEMSTGWYPWMSQEVASKGSVDKCSGLKLVMNLLEDIDLYRSRTTMPDLLDILYHFDDSLLPVLAGMIRIVVSGLDEDQCRNVFGGFMRFCSEVAGDGKLLGAFVRGLEPIYRYVDDLSELIRVFRGGDGWFTLLRYVDDRQKAEIYRRLMDSDGYYGMSRSVCIFPETMQAYFLQQVGKTREAQDLYEKIQKKAGEHRISFDENEYKKWQDEWIRCARELQQWDVCYEAGIETGDYSLSTESLWHLSSFTDQDALKRFKSMVDTGKNGFEKEFYDAFASTYAKYSAEKIGKILERNILELRSYPAGSNAGSRFLLYLQIIIEMIEAEPIFNDRIDGAESLTSILFRWKDKEPSDQDVFEQWSLFRTWRRHAYSRLGMIEKTYGGETVYKAPGRSYAEEMAASPGRRVPMTSHLFSPKEMIEGSIKVKKELIAKGTNELAKTLNGFSKAAIEHGYYDAALFHLKEVFDLSSVKVGDVFQKVVYELLCLLGKKEYKIGVEQCGSTNIQHFSDSQSSVLFNFKGLFSEKLGKFSDAEKFYLQSAQICNVVGENWLTWAKFLFNRINGEGVGPKEDAFVALLQAVVYCNGKKARKGILKLILLMDKHSSLCDTDMFHKVLQEIDISRFIYFIPQLIGLLSKEDAELVQIILAKISEEHPQAIAGPLKAARERIRRTLVPVEGKVGCEVQMCRPKMENKARPLGSVQLPEVKSFFLENIMQIYNQVKSKRLGREFWKILHYLHNSFNSHAFKEEELVYLEIEKIFNGAVSHIVHGTVPSGQDQAMLLNELISRVSLSSLSKGFKEDLISSILGMKCICPLENIDEMVRFKSRIQSVVEESFYKMGNSEEFEVNMLLHRSNHEHKMFGQYSEIRSTYKNLVNIEMFEPRQSYMYRKRMGCNRIHLRGSDGKMYRYEMKGLLKTRFSELALPQLSLMVNESMGESPDLSRRGAELKLFIPFVVSEVLVLECIKETVHYIDSILEEGLSEYNVSIDQCVLLYLNCFASIYEVEEGDCGDLESRYDLSKGLTKDKRTRGVGDECPNIRKRERSSGDEGLGENFVNNARMVIETQRETYVDGLRRNEISCLGCNGKGEGVAPCTYKYDISRRQRYIAYGKVYNTFKATNYIDDYFRLVYGSLGGYFGFKSKLLSSYSTNSAFLYTFSIVDRRPRNLVATRSAGHFMNRVVCCEETEGLSKGKGAAGVIGPSYQKLFRKEGIEGAMLSIMYHYADMLNEGDWYRDLMKVVLEGMFVDMKGDGLERVCSEAVSRISEMVGKGEDGTYNMISMISEWMDTFKLAQIDPRHMSWM
ncbi:FAT domain-containing protein [Encephalitozoon cuniculi EcunIII-L]|nr:FAT domain-containing protein [Encephalitozoon cuniculi EcunIII-L]UYI27846.1 FAT domain-containing protein [Encephalitozoon cuniculi]